MLSHQKNTQVFADGYKEMNDIFKNHVSSMSHMLPGLHFQNVQLELWRLRQNDSHFADNIFKFISSRETLYNLILIALKFVHKGSVDESSLVQIMAWH